MLRHWDDTFSNVFSGRQGTSVPIFVSMDHTNYAGRLMNPLSMAMDVHVCQACRRDRRPGLHIARVGSRLAQHQEQAGVKNKQEPGFRVEDRTNFVVFNKYTGGNHFELTWLDGDNDDDDDDNEAVHISDDMMDTAT